MDLGCPSLCLNAGSPSMTSNQATASAPKAEAAEFVRSAAIGSSRKRTFSCGEWGPSSRGTRPKSCLFRLGQPVSFPSLIDRLEHYKMVGSMGCAGAWDENAMMGLFLLLVQRNVLNRRCWRTCVEFTSRILIWIEPERTAIAADCNHNSADSPSSGASSSSKPLQPRTHSTPDRQSDWEPILDSCVPG